MISIREEQAGDIDAVREVNRLAFAQPQESRIVDSLREACDDLISLVALQGDRVVGHILFSPVVIEGEGGLIRGMGLAPMAVLPGCQGQGIGTALAKAGLAAVRRTPCPFVTVLGHPEYYPRFGFEPASRRGVQCPWPGVPDEAFRILVLDEVAMEGVTGVARYRGEFDVAS